ncbi:MAG: cytochrome c biogenesis protein CcsA [Bacteroidota bacterium]
MIGISDVHEHLLPGIIGKTAIYAAMGAALLSMVLYIVGSNKEHAEKKWLTRLADAFFGLNTLAVLTAAGILFWLLKQHFYEYNYVWQYSSNELPLKYIISCFWAGKEGSLLIWALWTAIIGMILMFTSGQYKKPVMIVFSLVQVFLCLMVAGIDVGSIIIGTSPFALLRDMPAYADYALFARSDYLSFITDGNGLNPLLRNPWMATHPPALFLGYAAALVPYAFAFASIVIKDKTGWQKTALPWALFSITALGAGLILGGAWAYEDLTFGGFWAWDPVENASLVPWLLLVAGLHFILTSKVNRQTVSTARIFSILPFIFVLYSAWLTRSGVLKDTSAHSFSESGASSGYLVMMGLLFIIPLIIALLNRVPGHEKKKETPFSREFFMFIGAVILVLSAFQVIFTTSLPVMNRISGSNLALPPDPVSFYNGWQMMFAVAACLLLVLSQFLTYGKNDLKRLMKRIAFSVVIALVITMPVAILMLHSLAYGIFSFFILFTIIGSLDMMLRLHRHLGNPAAALTHTGFGIFLMGVLITFSGKYVVSQNEQLTQKGVKVMSETMILVKGQVKQCGDEYVSYSGRVTENSTVHYQLDFLEKKGNDYFFKYSLFPAIEISETMGKAFVPDTRHFIDRDVFTYLTDAGIVDEEYKLLQTFEVERGVPFSAAHVMITADSIQWTMTPDSTCNVWLSVVNAGGKLVTGKASFVLTKEDLVSTPADFPETGLRIVLGRDEGKKLKTDIYTQNVDFVSVKVVHFPYIAMMWMGVVLIFAGLLFAIFRRIKKARTANMAHSDKPLDEQTGHDVEQ